MPLGKHTKENGGDPSGKKNKAKRKTQNVQDSDAISGSLSQDTPPDQFLERILMVLRVVMRQGELEDMESEYEEEIKREKEAHDLRITIEKLQDDRLKDRENYEKSNRELDILRQECEKTKDSLQAEKEKLESTRSAIEKQLRKEQEESVEYERARLGKEKKREILELNEKVTKLQDGHKKLVKEKSKLSEDLEKTKKDLVNANMMNDAFKDRIKNLQAEKNKQISEVAIKSHPSEFYIDGFNELAEQIQEVARIYFTHLPPDLESYESIKKVLNEIQNSSEIFKYTPASSAPIPNFLRRCGVEHFISTTICEFIARPFIDGCATEFNNSERPLGMIREQLLQTSARSENIWRALTVKGTAPSLNLGSLRTKVVKEDILPKLTDLISPQTRPELEKGLSVIFDCALNLWEALRRDSCSLELNFKPEVANKSTWLSPGSPALELSPSPKAEKGYSVRSTAPLPHNITSFALFPKISIFPSDEDANTNGDIQVGGLKRETEKASIVIYPGRALFSDSDAIKEGIRLQKRLETEYNQYMLAFPSQKLTSPIRPHLELLFPKQKQQGRPRVEPSDPQLDN